jgi:hypothetical protein
VHEPDVPDISISDIVTVLKGYVWWVEEWVVNWRFERVPEFVEVKRWSPA